VHGVANQRNSVLSALSCRRLEDIEETTSSKHSPRRPTNCSAYQRLGIKLRWLACRRRIHEVTTWRRARKVGGVQDEQDRSQNGALWYTAFQHRSSGTTRTTPNAFGIGPVRYMTPSNYRARLILSSQSYSSLKAGARNARELYTSRLELQWTICQLKYIADSPLYNSKRI
jgi:hypothetical protein